MKLNKLFLGAIAALASAAMVACSDDAPDVNNGGENGDDVRYLSVSIVSTPESRASVSNGFENGTTIENKVDKVRFYFFTAGGDAAKVKANSDLNYCDWDPKNTTITPATPTTTSRANDGNIEKTLNAVLVIDTKAGDRLPAMILAVINPDRTTLGDGSYNLTNLRLKYDDYAKLANEAGTADTDPAAFVMSNSVYAKGQEAIKATKLDVSDFKTTSDAAIAAPVDIYVERTMAKVRATLAVTTNANGLIRATTKATADEESKGITIHDGEDDVDVYIKINGWNVISTMPAANISKHISLSWNDNVLGDGIAWNDANNYRSYWAEQNQIGGQKNTNITWNGINKSFANNNTIYVNENADRTGNSGLEPTRIIVSATLCKSDGTNLTVCEYAGLKFADTYPNLPSLKAMVLTYLNSEHKHYKAVTTGEGEDAVTKYVKIEPADIEFSQNTTATKDKYAVSAKLTAVAQSYTWYTATNDKDEITDVNLLQPVEYTEIYTHLRQQQTAMVYTNGATYYFAPIQHYTKDGVVRNHIYDITANGFYGLGTPVYNPEEIIFPEKPLNQEAFLAARINILSWHVMTQGVTFE